MSSAKTSPAAAASGRLETMMSHFMKGPLGSVQTIAVFGAGLMGSGIAQVAAQAGFKVLLIDVNDKAINNGLDIIKKSLARVGKRIAPDNIAEFSALVMSKIETTTDRADAAKADLVIEAIIENLEIKRELFAFLDKTTRPECIFATNTSSLLVTDIYTTVSDERKKRFGGLHYFNPVPVMQLVEVVRTEQTSEESIKTMFDVNKKMGKVPVLAKDKPGFIVNRLLAAYNREAVKMLERGDATVEDIDTAMKLGAGYPMGPFELMDVTGLDLSQNIAREWIEYNKRGLVPDYLTGYSPILQQLVKEGRYGRKNGRGFYEYKDGKKVTKKSRN